MARQDWGPAPVQGVGLVVSSPLQVLRVYIESQSVSQFSRSAVSDSAAPWTVACQASLSTTNSQSSPKLRSIESVMHLGLCEYHGYLNNTAINTGVYVSFQISVFVFFRYIPGDRIVES